MGRLPLGVVSPYVKTSSGGSMDPMKFYATSYGTAYGKDLIHEGKDSFQLVATMAITRLWKGVDHLKKAV